MEEKESLLNALSKFIDIHQAKLVDEWWKTCEDDPSLEPVGKLTREEFRNNIPAALEGFRGILVCVDEEVLNMIKTEVAKHGHHRWRQGFNLRELIRDWGHLNRTMIIIIERFFASHGGIVHEAHQEALDRLALFMTEATSGSVQRYDELRREESLALEKDLSNAEDKFNTITKARSSLLRETAHDLQGRVSALSLHSQLFRNSSEESPSFDKVLDRMDGGLNSVSKMLRSLLDLTRLESGKETVELSRVNIVKTLTKLASEVEGVALQKEIELRAEGPEELFVTTDTEKIHRIAQNLIVNALQHTAEGHVTLSWLLEREQWHLIVEDTGPGLQATKGSNLAKELKGSDSDTSPENSDEGFAYTGEGIGLTIVKRLCSLLHASIDLESTEGEGSTFTVRFPLAYSEE